MVQLCVQCHNSCETLLVGRCTDRHDNTSRYVWECMSLTMVVLTHCNVVVQVHNWWLNG